MTEARPSGARRRGPGESTLYRIRAATSARQLKALLFATLSGCLIFLSFPNYDVFPLQWVALIPLFFVMSDRRPGRAFGWGLWTGFVTNWGGFYWITGMLMDFGHFSLAVAIPLASLMCLYQGLVFGLFAGLTRWIMLYTNAPILWVAPTVFTFVEYAQPLIFPWYMGNGQYRFHAICQIVELTGVPGLTFLIVLVNAALYTAYRAYTSDPRRDYKRPLILAGAMFGVTLIFGLVRIRQVESDEAAASKLRIGLGEANVGIFEKEANHLRSNAERIWMLRGNIMKHHLLAAALERDHDVDLIVLPESSFIPVFPPYGSVRFKRSDAFMLASTLDGAVYERSVDAWQPAGTVRPGAAIRDIASAGDFHSVAVGDGGLVMRSEDGGWRTESSGTQTDLHGAWAGPAVAAYGQYDGDPWFAAAVGEQGTFLVREVDGWRVVPDAGSASLAAVDGVDAGHLIAVGARGSVLRFDGEKLTREDAHITSALTDVWAQSDSEFWAVGEGGVVVHRDDGKWTQQVVGSKALRAVTGAPGVLAIGGDGGVWLRNGDAWSESEFKGFATDLSVDPRGDLVAVAGGHVIQSGTLSPVPPGKDPSKLVGRTVTWGQPRELPRGAEITGLAPVPFTSAHAYARDARWVYRSHTALPDTTGDLVENVHDVQSRVLPEDVGTPESEWNVPVRGFDTPVLLGLITYDPASPAASPVRDGRDGRHSYNSAVLLGADGQVLGRYDKNYLLVFGEYIPLGDRFPQFYDWLPEASHFYSGTTVETFPFKGHQLGLMICYEDIISAFTRRLADKNPNVLINVTNDAWFGKTSEPAHHLALATFRAIENRLWLVRSTNTGISAFVDAAGRIVGGTDLDNAEVLVRDVPMLESETLYRSLGDWFAWLAGIAVFSACINAGMASRRSRASGRTI